MGIMGSFKFKKSCKKQCSKRFSIVRFLKYINNKIEKDLANFIINFIISKVASCIERMLRLSLFSYLQFWLNLIMDGWLLFLTSTTSHPQHHKSSKERKTTNTYIHPSIQSSQGTWLFIQNFIFIFIHPFKWCNIWDIHGCNFLPRKEKRSDL